MTRHRPTALSARGQKAFQAVLLALCALAAAVVPAVAQEPVDELRRILKETADPAARERALHEQARRLDGIAELGRAVALSEWQDTSADDHLAAVDRASRDGIVDRFEQAVRHVLRRGDPVSRQAVLNLLTKMGPEIRGSRGSTSLTAVFSFDLAYLVKQPDAATRRAAARALGLLNPRLEAALPALAPLLTASQPADRLAAAEALTALVHISAGFANRDRPPGGVELSREDLVRVGQAVVPLAGRGLADRDPKVRSRCLSALAEAAAIVHRCVDSRRNSEDHDVDDRKEVETEAAELQPLLAALRAQGPALTRAMGDADPEVRVLARRVLESMLDPQLRLVERAAGRTGTARPAAVALQPSHFVSPAAGRDPVLQGLNQTVQALAAAVTDSDVRARRAAIDVLETLGPAAAVAARALVTALGDPDPFMRWAAARTLGKVSPVAADSAVPALARLMTDQDLDVRLAAAAALEQYGPAARRAVPELIYAVRSSDAELRIAAIRALGAVGGAAMQQALPELRLALADGDARVRQAAADVLGRLGPAARPAAPALQAALQDSDPAVQKAASEALLNILHGRKQ
jgi:HEAT repeat protein